MRASSIGSSIASATRLIDRLSSRLGLLTCRQLHHASALVSQVVYLAVARPRASVPFDSAVSREQAWAVTGDFARRPHTWPRACAIARLTAIIGIRAR